MENGRDRNREIEKFFDFSSDPTYNDILFKIFACGATLKFNIQRHFRFTVLLSTGDQVGSLPKIRSKNNG